MPDEITPEDALAVSEELCDRFLQGRYQYVLAVHSDHEHIHAHIIFSNTNANNGLSFTTEENQGGRRERAWAKLRQISDEICQEHKLSVITEPEKGMGISHYELDMQNEGKSWKEKLRHKLAKAIMKSFSFEDFLRRCRKKGIEVVYEPTHKYKIKYRLEGQQKFVRGETLGEFYTADAIAEQIELIYKTAEENMRKANAEPAPKPTIIEVPKSQPTPSVTTAKIEPIAEPKPTITAVPKTEPTTAPSERGGVVYNALLEAMRKRGIEPTPSTVSEPADRVEITEEEFLSGATSQDELITTAEPIEVLSEKEEIEVDPWAGLRDIGNSDMMIAELEEIGFTSYDDLSYFLKLGVHEKHPQDHEDEIKYKKARIKRLETLIDSIQRRDRLAPIFTESESKTGWSKSRYDKKHHDELYDYGTAVNYIKKHLDEFKTKEGNTSTLKDLQDRLKRMKKKLKELEDENSIYLTKSRGVTRYVTKIRRIRNENYNKRQRELSNERMRSQQRKKSYLE